MVNYEGDKDRQYNTPSLTTYGNAQYNWAVPWQ